jgi:16S rRNA (guanine1207-N2)-methyltransferase
MAEQYFSKAPQSKSSPEQIEIAYQGRVLSFITDAGVFSKYGLDEGSRLLLDALPQKLRGRVLDLGCGWGAIGIIIGACHPETEIVMADINQRALSLARTNAANNQVQADCRISDGFMDIPGVFDYIVTNPPIRAGKQTIYRMFAGCKDRLKPEGILYIVIRKQQGAPSAQEYLKSIYPRVTIVCKSRGYWVIMCQGAINGI